MTDTNMARCLFLPIRFRCRAIAGLILSVFLAVPAPAQPTLPKPAVPDKVADVFQSVNYDQHKATFAGYLGERMRINLEKRLLTLDLPSILEPYVHRPGRQTWIGEHVGKFLHAGCLVWQYTGNETLKSRLDSTARVLIATQLPDGYLGTYAEKDRWTNWDVWSHKYNLIGLLTYYQTTGYPPALAASQKMGDLLIRVFQTGGKDLIKASWHVGMASTSVLEPTVMLYRMTGEKRYLDFCRFIVNSWEQANGPHILTSLLNGNGVAKTANGKAYEMLSNIVGLADLYRMTGDERYLQACRNAWEDIRQRRHYPVGTTSWGEHFQADYSLRPDGEVHGDKYEGPGEGCVTVTWLQLNWHLLRLTGEPKYADELERITFNALTAAQSPQNGSVCYFIPMSGRKRFGEVNHGILPDVSCCASSVPRGLALVPFFIVGTQAGGAVVWQYVPGQYDIQPGATTEPATLTVTTRYPLDENVKLTIGLPTGSPGRKFLLRLRIPAWCAGATVRVGSDSLRGNAGQLLTLDRRWQSGDVVQLSLPMPIREVAYPPKLPGEIVLERGPQVLAQDDRLDTVNDLPKDWTGSQFYHVTGKHNGQEKTYRLVPFADAGQTGGHYEVLLPPLTDLKTAIK